MDTQSPPRVLVTRAAEDAPPLAYHLGQIGYAPVVVPLIQRRWHVPAVAEAVQQSPGFHIVIVTSPTAAQILATAAPQAFDSAEFAVVGDASAAALSRLGFPIHVMPERYTAAHLVEALLRSRAGSLEGCRVLYPRADLASPHTREALEAAGATVVDVVAYTNAAPPDHTSRVLEALPVDLTTLMSGSAARRLAAAVPAEQRHKLGKVIVIGPSTQRVAAHAGLYVHSVARPHSVAGLVAAVAEAYPIY